MTGIGNLADTDCYSIYKMNGKVLHHTKDRESAVS
jgi:hypothetical protein